MHGVRPEVVFVNEKPTVPAVPVVPEPLAGVGEPTPETEKLTGMKVSFSPLSPVT